MKFENYDSVDFFLRKIIIVINIYLFFIVFVYEIHIKYEFDNYDS